ncbi:MAG: hypothetical protein IJR74_02140 [Paludibacteraceae bacterium]|nr:hypothetical protein [Paludibacteraceae bacterium]
MCSLQSYDRAFGWDVDVAEADSAAAADAYIRAWATPLLEAEMGAKMAEADIDELLRDYQQTLYQYAYERRIWHYQRRV